MVSTDDKLARIALNEKIAYSWVIMGWKDINRWIYDPKYYPLDVIIEKMHNNGFFSVHVDGFWPSPRKKDETFYAEFTAYHDSNSYQTVFFFAKEEDATHFKLLMD